MSSRAVRAKCRTCEVVHVIPMTFMREDDKIVGWIGACTTPQCDGVIAVRAKHDVVVDHE